MSNDKNPSFFEPRTLIAFSLTMIVFVLWQNYMKQKYPHIYDKPKTVVENNNKTSEIKSSPELSAPTNNPVKKTKDINEVQKIDLKSVVSCKDGQPSADNKFCLENYNFDGKNWSAQVSNLGLEFKEIKLKTYNDRKSKPLTFNNLFKTTLLGSEEPLVFSFGSKDQNQLEATYSSENGSIKKTLIFDPNSYSFEASYSIQGSLPGVSLFIEYPLTDEIKSSLFFPTFERQEFVVVDSEGEQRDMLTIKDFSTRSFNQAKIVSLGSQFFSNSIIDNSTLKPKAIVFVNEKQKKAIVRLDYEFSKDLKSFEIRQKFFTGPKDDVILKSVDRDLISLINFGMFKFLCEPILAVLKFFYSLSANYGVAIILLTLLMRILVFPIAYRGYKSMDKMQKIQPQLKAIREKFKNDPQQANIQTMALMKDNKVNPIGGCLPMLLQLPIFFAFYRVLSESIVMYQSPFILWITDLSLKDQFYVLPVLMAITMFIQQKLTPTALEPMQQKVMLFMPVVFSLLMISLPSALTLYIFVSTLFGVLQQYLFTKSKT